MTNPDDHTHLFHIKSDFNRARHKTFSALLNLVNWTCNKLRVLDEDEFDTDQALLYMALEIEELTHYMNGHDLKSLRSVDTFERRGFCTYLLSIGEMVNHIDDTDKDVYPEIPWNALMRVRNGLAHRDFMHLTRDEYWVDISRFLIQDIPKLKIYLDEMLEDYSLQPEDDAVDLKYT